MAPRKRTVTAHDADFVTPAKKRDKVGAETPTTPWSSTATPGSSPPLTSPSSGEELQRPTCEQLADPNKSWLTPVLSTIASIHEQGVGLHEWLQQQVERVGIEAWVEMLDEAFPPAPGVSYL